MKKESKITVLSLAILFIGWSVACWLNPVKEYSVAERTDAKGFTANSI